VSVLSRGQARSRERTLLAAVLLSMWAPLTTGIAVLLSHSTTQLADFVRRSVELVALVVAWRVFRHLQRPGVAGPSPAQRARLERVAGLSVAAAMGCSGAVMLLLALSRLQDFTPGGNVYPGLIIAVLGLITNSWFWRRYARLNREQHDAVIDSQRQLYQAKAFVDLCVAGALAAVAIDPGHIVTRYVDLLGSLTVAAYLLWNGWRSYANHR
jgi:divalent metal cation (Fe/Co/Zn/Cd) transporter